MTNDYKAIAGKLADALMSAKEILCSMSIQYHSQECEEGFNICTQALTALNEMGDGDVA